MNARREVWIKNKGPIPKGWLSVNLNGQPSDLRVENIAVVPRSSQLRAIIAPFEKRIRKLERQLNAVENTKEETK